MPLKYLAGLALKESTTEWGRCLSGREQWSKEQLKYTVFLARSGNRMKIFAIQWHYISRHHSNFSLKWFLIDFLPYGAWQAVTHVSFQSFLMNWSPVPSHTIVSSAYGGKMTNMSK